MSIPDYYNRVNRDLFRLIPPDAGTVLEIGCGAGALAREYRRINPDVVYLGVEVVPEAASAAGTSGRLNRVFTGDAALVEPADLGLSAIEPAIDCLVFGDVLEHMVDPWSVLAQARRMGAQKRAGIGMHTQHSALLGARKLAAREVAVSGRGAARPHALAFFYSPGSQGSLRRRWPACFRYSAAVVAEHDFDKFQQVMAPVLSTLAIEPAALAAQTQAVQYIVRAIRAEAPPRRMVIRSLLGSVVGSEPRIGEPARFLASIPGVRALSGTALRFFDALSSPQKAFEPLCSYDRYLELLQAADIALLPLEPTRFNQHKSDLKFVECAANGAAVLASPTVYKRTVDHDQTGLIYHSPTEFGMMLERLIRERPLRRRLARNAFQFVAQDRMLAHHYQARHEWYRGISSRRAS